jgi:ArsR family transcriptional regulator, arsenate/arsenite/antimonite-responsive transcriptional repressor
MTAGDLARRFAHSWPTVTRHLKELEAAGLVTVESQGRERHYQVDHARLLAVTGLWLGAFTSDR